MSDVLDGGESGLVEGGVVAALLDLDVAGRTVAGDLEGDVDAAPGGLVVEHVDIPLRLELPVDLLNVEGEARAECGIRDADGKGADAGLAAGHRDVEATGLAGLDFVGIGFGGPEDAAGAVGCSYRRRAAVSLMSWRGLARSSGRMAAAVGGAGAMGAGLGFSVARTLCSSIGWRGGSGRELTMVASMAPAVAAASPQLWP